MKQGWRGRILTAPISVHLALLSVLTALPLLAALIVFLNYSSAQQRREIEGRLIEERNGLVDNLDRDLQRHLIILDTLASSPLLAQRDWRRFYDQSKAALHGQTYLILVDPAGRQLVNTYVPFGEAPETTGDMDTVRRIIATRQPVFSNLFMSKVVRRPVLNVSIPVMNGDEVAFVMSIAILPEKLADILTGLHLDPQWVTTIWDADGRLIARSRNMDRFLGVQLPQSMRPQGPNQTLYLVTDLEGNQAIRVVGVSQISGWGVSVNVPTDVVRRPIEAGWWLLVGTVAVAALLTVLFALVMNRMVGASLDRLSQAARGLGRQERPPLLSSRISEVGAISQALVLAYEELDRAAAERSRAERQRLTLIGELNHRVKNTLAVVQAVAYRTFGTSGPTTGATAVFQARLRALAAAHDVLTRRNWQGADLDEVIAAVIEPYRAGAETRFEIGGPDVLLPPRQALALSMALHELCTNSAKYGALSAPEGRVKIAWNVESERFKFMWQERGGPPVAAPARKGFGMQLIENMVAQDMDAAVALSYPPEGVVCVIDGPLPSPEPGSTPVETSQEL